MKAGQTDGHLDGRMDGTCRFPLYSTGLCPLRFPPGPLPCLPNSYLDEILKQGKGNDDHLLPLGDWFLMKSPWFDLDKNPLSFDDDEDQS